MTINVYCGSVSNRNLYEVSDSDTIKSVMERCAEEHGVDFNTGVTNLNGIPLRMMDMDRTFADYNVTDTAFLVNSPKSDGGNQ